MKIPPRGAVLAAVLMFAALLAPASAADYPTKPIKIVVSYPPGGGMDVMGRLLAAPLAERLKQSVLVENRPGASGMIGAEYVARQAPDGYTLIFAPADTHSIDPHVYTNIRYDARKDFEPIAYIGSFPIALVVNPSFPAKTVADFVKMVREQPGKVSFASWGIGSSSHVAMEVLLVNSGLKMLHVPYTGAAPAITAVIAGQVDSMMVTLPTAEPYHNAGKIRILGVTPTSRPPGAATYPEEGMPSEIVLWGGILAPAKTPPHIVSLLNREIRAVMQDPQVRNGLANAGLEPPAEVGSPANFAALLNKQYDAWGRTIRAAHISMEFK
jgi:tripartite-type tricarboxylate transporter receptor subunit TctC